MIGLEEWFLTVPKIRGRLYNILRRLCLKQFNNGYEDISPLAITKEEFLSLDGAGKRSWNYFKELKKQRKNKVCKTKFQPIP